MNRWVLRWDLKDVMLLDCRMCGGREFQSLGGVQLKALASIVLRPEVGMVRRPAEEEHREGRGCTCGEGQRDR